MSRGTRSLSNIQRGGPGSGGGRGWPTYLWAVLLVGLGIWTLAAGGETLGAGLPATPGPLPSPGPATEVEAQEAPAPWNFVGPDGNPVTMGAGEPGPIQFPQAPTLLPVAGQPGSPGSPMPDWQLPSLDGEGLDLSAYRGRPVVLNFFASWCGPCREEAPVLKDLQEAADTEGFAVIGVAMLDDPASARRFMEEEGLDFPVGIDRDGSRARSLQVLGPPTTFFIDADGIIRHRVLGTLREAAAWEGVARAAGKVAVDAESMGAAAALPVAGTGLWGLLFAAGAGLLSFLSPCVLPLLPAYLGYMTGMSVNELKGPSLAAQRRQVFLRTLAFAVGLMAVFTALGASASFVGGWLAEYRSLLTRVAGALVIVFGLHVMGLLPSSFLDREYRPGLGLVAGTGGGLSRPLFMGDRKSVV